MTDHKATDQISTPTTGEGKAKTQTKAKTMTGASILWECLEREGV